MCTLCVQKQLCSHKIPFHAFFFLFLKRNNQHNTSIFYGSSPMIQSFNSLIDSLPKKNKRITIAAIAATDDATLLALFKAIKEGFIRTIFVGGEEKIRHNTDFNAVADHCLFLPSCTPTEACTIAVKEIREGRADILMKGLVNTDILLRAILNKDTGILHKGNILTHLSCAEIPFLDRLLVFSDAAVIPYPTLAQRRQQLHALSNICHSMQIDCPRISLLHCTEQINEKIFPFITDYLTLKEEAKKGIYGSVIVDGPLDLKTSLNKKALDHKGILSPIDGKADALLFPNIEAGNVFYKTITMLPNVRMACMLYGADAPVVLTSRSDNTDSKYYSIVLAATAINKIKRE